MYRFLCAVVASAGLLMVGGASASGTTAPIPITIDSYTLTPPYLINDGSTKLALSDWKLRLISPYQDTYNFPALRLMHFGCQATPEPKHPKIILQGRIDLQPQVSYQVQYRDAGQSNWNLLEDLNLGSGSDGFFQANYFDVPGQPCPTHNITFRVVGQDTSGNEYVSANKVLRVLPNVRVGQGPKQPPNYHVGTVWFAKIHVTDPFVTQVQVRQVAKLDPQRKWKLSPTTHYRFMKNVPVRNGLAVFKYRIPNAKTHVFRFVIAGTPLHAPIAKYDWVYLGE